jgi:lysyl-tRNA synthetase class 2
LTQSQWWHRDVHGARRPILIARNAIASAIRTYFADDGFIEIDAAALQVSPGNETHIHAFPVVLNRLDGTALTRYLHTSPEFAMKKLLAAGETKIFSMGHVFRDREHGPLHAPEFTMLEWYRAGTSYRRIIDDCLKVLELALAASQAQSFRYRLHAADLNRQARMLTVAEAFSQYAGIDLLATCVDDASASREALAQSARRAGLTVRESDGWSDIFSRLMVALIEPRLAAEGVCVLHQYPRSEAALAALNSDDPRIADRFELYVCGVELANGFRELTDAAEQRRRFEAAMEEKHRLYGERYPIDEDFLAALPAMPEASGVALGFDRLVMLATGAPSVHQVSWTPLESG